MSVIYTAIIGPWDDLKKPKVITPGWRYVAFTDQDLESDVWEIHKVKDVKDASRTARQIKIMAYADFEETATIWVDGSFVINCDLNRWMRNINGPLTVIRHPERDCVYEEARECISQRRGNADEVAKQWSAYKEERMPAHNGLISTGIIMRSKVPSVQSFCEQWWKELSKYSTRDQLSFAHTAWLNPNIHSQITWDYRVGGEFQHVPHLHNPNRIHRLKVLGLNH